MRVNYETVVAHLLGNALGWLAFFAIAILLGASSPVEDSSSSAIVTIQDPNANDDVARVKAQTLELLPATIDGADRPIVFHAIDGEEVAWLDRNCEIHVDPRYATGAAYAFMADAMQRAFLSYTDATTLSEISCSGADGFRVTWSWKDMAHGHLVIVSLVREEKPEEKPQEKTEAKKSRERR